MKKLYLHIAIVLVGLAGLSITAKAQAVDQVIMTVPFEFVATGKTLPAGTYRVHRLSENSLGTLVVTNLDNNASAIVLANQVASAPTDKAKVTFETAGDEHFISKVETADNIYTIPVPHAAMLLAYGKSHTGTASGTSSGRD